MTPRRPTALVAAALASAVALGAASCSIGEDSAPRDIPVEERPRFGGGAAEGPASGSSRIYLINTAEAEQPLLRSVQRDVPSEPVAVLNALLEGRTESEQLETAIPADLQILTARRRSQVLTVDVNDAFSEIIEADDLALAVAQIVATATAIDNVQRVRLRINGENQEWPIGPLGNTELVDRPLSVYDYATLIESTQPPFPAIPSAN